MDKQEKLVTMLLRYKGNVPYQKEFYDNGM